MNNLDHDSERESRRVRLTAAYEGTSYNGWQLQPDVPTVQGTLEQTLGKILGESPRVTGAGRTDAGVHALGQVAHFDTSSAMKPAEMERALNALLPRDIRVRGVAYTDPEFHARYGARSKLYRYSIHDEHWPESIFRARTCWLHQVAGLDFDGMRECAACITGTHDFTTFSRQEGHRENRDCTVLEARWALSGNGRGAVFEIRGDRFLRGMVRMLAGAMVAVGSGRIDADSFREALSGKKPWKYAVVAPACGLTLVEVHY